MLRALLWVSEVRLADDIAAAWRAFHRELAREYTEAGRRRDNLAWQRSDQIAVDCHKAADELADKLWDEQQEAADALRQCQDIVQEFTTRLELRLDDDQGDLTRAALALLNDHLPPARQRFTALMSNDRQELHTLATLEERKRRAASTQCTTIEQLDAMEQHEFNVTVLQALKRSGFQVHSRGPRVLEVSRDGGEGLVYCAHVQHPGHNETTDVRTMLTAQRLAETRGFPGVLLVTNLRYLSRPAYRLLQEWDDNFRIVQRFDLQQWLGWDVPLRSLLGSA
ncbi:hypothetical protein BIV24_09170 [Streptomyces colonosanans]|uniref:Restriction endonuclease type IV Mrr domain-containing protein n=2 Tax=Streptomyces colonosanans TaxID=1428652 RepID=A0A1S2PNP9_9ACTN|nr:hypothetical protein BIV24_09170 [Streptomyces colonosanans]